MRNQAECKCCPGAGRKRKGEVNINHMNAWVSTGFFGAVLEHMLWAAPDPKHPLAYTLAV